MKEFCDLHIHSIYSSDGQHTIEELIEILKKNNIKMAAITDHNEIKGTLEFYNKIKDSEIIPVKGVELSTRGKNRENIHLLLYKIKECEPLNKALNVINTQYIELSKMRIEKLNKLGFKVTLRDVLNEEKIVPSMGPTIGAAILHNPENAHDPRLKPFRNKESGDYEFYKKYMRNPNSPAYVKFHEYTVYDGLSLAKECDFIPVLAHPGYSLRHFDLAGQESFIKDLIENGLKGIEVYSSHHDQDMIHFFKHIAEKYDLLITGGSDFHGIKTKPDITIEKYKIKCSFIKKAFDLFKG